MNTNVIVIIATYLSMGKMPTFITGYTHIQGGIWVHGCPFYIVHEPMSLGSDGWDGPWSFVVFLPNSIACGR